MSQEKQAEPAAGRETCLCREALRWATGIARLPQPTRQHLNNSRVEFLRAIRSLIDARIEYLLRSNQRGTRVVVD